MKVKDVTLYICEYCGKRLIRKHAMIKHESNCPKNPKNIPACFNCEHCLKEDISYYIDTDANDPDGYIEVKATCLKCDNTGQLMYPPKAERYAKKHIDQFEDQVRMPQICQHQKAFNSPDALVLFFGANKKEEK